MALVRPAKRRRTDMEQVAQIERRQIIQIAGINWVGAEANAGNSNNQPAVSGDVPADFTFPVIQITETPVVEQTTLIPVVTTFVATATAYIPALAPSPAVALPPPAVTPSPAVVLLPPAPTKPAVVPGQGSSTMSTALRQGTTTVEAQQGQPSIGMFAPKPNATTNMDQWTARILIIAGSIAGALVLFFLVLIIHRWRQGKKPFSSLFSWSKSVDEEEDEDDLQPYSTTIPHFDPIDPRFSTYQKPIWDINSSMNSLPQKPNMGYNGNISSPRGPSPFYKQAKPSQSRFPPPNRIQNQPTMAEPRMFFRNQPRDSKVDITVHFDQVNPFEPSESGPLDGTRIDDFRSYEEMKGKVQEKDSKFSWTNSHAPKSPPRRPARQSHGTSETSEPRYMEVDGWVGQQTNRLVEFQIQQLFDEALDAHGNDDGPGVLRKTPAPMAEAVMPLYVPENYKEQAMTKMVESSSSNNSRTNLNSVPAVQAAPPRGIAATSLYDRLARGRY